MKNQENNNNKMAGTFTDMGKAFEYAYQNGISGNIDWLMVPETKPCVADIWDRLIAMRNELELTEGNEELLETIFYLLDGMRGGYDVTEEAMNILNN